MKKPASKPAIKPVPPVKITEHCRVRAAWALQSLSKVFSLDDDEVDSALNELRQCQRYLGHCSDLLQPVSKLTAEEAELSRAIHQFLRKGCDSSLSVVLYRLIDESRGQQVWHAFIKGLLSSGYSYHQALLVAKRIGKCDTDSLAMEYCLGQFSDDFDACLGYFDWKLK